MAKYRPYDRSHDELVALAKNGVNTAEHKLLVLRNRKELLNREIEKAERGVEEMKHNLKMLLGQSYCGGGISGY